MILGNARHGNDMHPTADTLIVILKESLGRR